jgi:hypothetical protein
MYQDHPQYHLQSHHYPFPRLFHKPLFFRVGHAAVGDRHLLARIAGRLLLMTIQSVRYYFVWMMVVLGQENCGQLIGYVWAFGVEVYLLDRVTPRPCLVRLEILL